MTISLTIVGGDRAEGSLWVIRGHPSGDQSENSSLKRHRRTPIRDPCLDEPRPSHSRRLTSEEPTRTPHSDACPARTDRGCPCRSLPEGRCPWAASTTAPRNARAEGYSDGAWRTMPGQSTPRGATIESDPRSDAQAGPAGCCPSMAGWTSPRTSDGQASSVGWVARSAMPRDRPMDEPQAKHGQAGDGWPSQIWDSPDGRSPGSHHSDPCPSQVCLRTPGTGMGHACPGRGMIRRMTTRRLSGGRPLRRMTLEY